MLIRELIRLIMRIFQIHEIRNLVKSLPSLYDCTVLISSHMLSEIELIADAATIFPYHHSRQRYEIHLL